MSLKAFEAKAGKTQIGFENLRTSLIDFSIDLEYSVKKVKDTLPGEIKDIQARIGKIKRDLSELREGARDLGVVATVSSVIGAELLCLGALCPPLLIGAAIAGVVGAVTGGVALSMLAGSKEQELVSELDKEQTKLADKTITLGSVPAAEQLVSNSQAEVVQMCEGLKELSKVFALMRTRLQEIKNNLILAGTGDERVSEFLRTINLNSAVNLYAELANALELYADGIDDSEVHN